VSSGVTVFFLSKLETQIYISTWKGLRQCKFNTSFSIQCRVLQEVKLFDSMACSSASQVFRFNSMFFSKSDIFMKIFLAVAVLSIGLQKQKLSFYVVTVSIPDINEKLG
jgi:hypothetical protein